MTTTAEPNVIDALAAAPLHPWNDGAPPKAPGAEGRTLRRLSPEQVDHYVEHGYVRIDDVFDPERLAEVGRSIDPHDERINDLLHQMGGRVSVAAADILTITLHLSTFDPGCRALAYDPAIADVVHDLVGPDARLYWDQAVYKRPRTDDVVPWHQDNGYGYVEPQEYLTIWVPLGDATLDNGTVWVVPDGHRRGTLVHDATEEGQRCLPEITEGAVAVPLPAGSVVAFSSLTPHRTGPNLTDETRRAYILQYAPDGAAVLEGDPSAPPVGRTPCADPGRQHLVVSGGLPVAPPPLSS